MSPIASVKSPFSLIVNSTSGRCDGAEEKENGWPEPMKGWRSRARNAYWPGSKSDRFAVDRPNGESPGRSGDRRDLDDLVCSAHAAERADDVDDDE